MGAAEDNWLCETVVARRDDETPTIDMGRAPRAPRRKSSGTAVMLRPLGLAPMKPQSFATAALPSPASGPSEPGPASCRRPKIAVTAGTELPAPAAPRPSYERRIVWIVSALLVVVFAWRAVPIAAARLSTVAAKLSTPSDP